MRVVFIPPSEHEFKKLFSSIPLKKGSGLDDITVFQPPVSYMRGGGIFSTLSGIAKRALPFLIKTMSPSIQEFGQGVFTDVVSGNKSLKSSMKNRGVRALKKTGKRILKNVMKSKRLGGKKKKKKKKTNLRNVGYKRDVYDLL